MEEPIKIVTIHTRTLEKKIAEYKKQNGVLPVLLMNEATYSMLDVFDKIDEPGETSIETSDGYIAMLSGCIIAEDTGLGVGMVRMDDPQKYEEALKDEKAETRVGTENQGET